MKTTRITFEGALGVTLAGRLDAPAIGKPSSFALFAHCFTCGKDLKAIRNITRALAARGIATLRFDFTGLGQSEGGFEDTTFSSNADDLVAAARWLEAHHAAPQLLIGHSLGGAAVLHAAARIKSAKAVATLGAPCDPHHVAHLLESSRETIERDGIAIVTLAGRPFRISKAFLDDLAHRSPKTIVRRLGRALLVLHAPGDKTVGIENAKRLYEAARHPKSFVSLDGADHLLSAEPDGRYAGDVIAAWAGRYLTPASAESLRLDAGDYQAAVYTGPEGFQTDVVVNGHRLLADEPTSVGGSDLGPSPYDLLIAGLGACTSMTLRMYADRKKWPLIGVTVRLRHTKIHAADCADCETETGRVDQIERELTLHGDLDPTQRDRLVAIADRCPVHRTLHGEIKVRTTLAAAQEQQ
jgi:uncharacterized OsmC-like protein/alpha/beta superfamily hydrolase